MKSSDIVIIGAGPGGCGTSFFLSKAGIPHTLIDKSTFPRDKICGDALSGKTMYVLNQLDDSFGKYMMQHSEMFLPSYGVQFVAPNGKSIDIPFAQHFDFTQTAPGYISKRFDFDNYLVSKLNSNYCELRLQTELLAIEKNANGIDIQVQTANGIEQIKGIKLLIGSDGSRSKVAAEMSAIKKENLHYCAGIRQYYSGVKNLHQQNFIELHFLPEMLPGYLWIFPMPGAMANVGAGMLSDTISKHKINLKQRFQEALKNNPALSSRFENAKAESPLEGWGLPLGSKKRNISGDNFLLTGDAASLIDPFTGEGIGNALYSGMMAAKHIEHAIKENRFDKSFNLQYDQAFYSRQWDELKLSHTLQKLSNYPGLFNFVVNKAHASKTLRETISCMFEDIDLRKQLRNPAFYLKIVFNR